MRRPTQTLRWMAAQRGRRRLNQFALFARNGYADHNSSKPFPGILDPLRAENCLVPPPSSTDRPFGASSADNATDEGADMLNQGT